MSLTRSIDKSRTANFAGSPRRARIAGLFAITAGLFVALFVFGWAVYTHHLNREAHRLFIEASAHGDYSGLAAAHAQLTALLSFQPRGVVPLDWASTQGNLGVVLTALGHRERETAHLEDAVTAFRAASQEYSRRNASQEWAAVENGLGTALRTIGEREGGTARLEEAVGAHRAALAEYQRERMPFLWAATQNQLGLALWRLGERESGTDRLGEAVAAFQSALQEHSRDQAPFQWAKTQTALGLALTSLGAREANGKLHLEQAVSAYDSALPVLMSVGDDRYAKICRDGRDRAIALLGGE